MKDYDAKARELIEARFPAADGFEVRGPMQHGKEPREVWWVRIPTARLGLPPKGGRTLIGTVVYGPERSFTDPHQPPTEQVVRDVREDFDSLVADERAKQQ